MISNFKRIPRKILKHGRDIKSWKKFSMVNTTKKYYDRKRFLSACNYLQRNSTNLYIENCEKLL